MAFNRLAELPNRVIQKMCRACLVTFAGLLGIILILENVFQGGQVIKSLMLGIVLWLLPNVYFAIKILNRLGQISGKGLLNIFYRAELIKLLFSGIFFIMVIKFLSVNIPILLLAYLVSQLVFWLLLIIKSQECLL